MSRLLRPRYLVVLLAAVLVVALGVGAGVLLRPKSTSQGKLLVLLTVDVPLAQHARSQEERAVGLRLLPSAQGSSWISVTVPVTKVALPGNWTAPNSDSLFLATVPAQGYRAAELEMQATSGRRLDDSRKLVMKVAKTGLTPLLFTFRVGQASPAGSPATVTAAAAYGGNDEVNFGLEVAQGKVMSLPSLPLVNQAGQTVSLNQYRGKVLIVASFLTECQETCPLVAAALLQLQHLLKQQHLQNQVQIVEVSQDPEDDTPAILTKYQKYFSLPWPLLTGTSANVNQFWSQLKVPPVQAQAWDGPAPVDTFTGQKEPYNLIHASVVDVVNPQGYVVSELEDQPTLSLTTIPTVIYKYLDAQGQQEEKAGGSWTPESLLGEVTPILERDGTYTKLPNAGGAATVGKPAPDFSLTSSAGGSVALSQEAGQPVLIDFWATWCTNCQADMKLVAQTAQKYRAQGLRVLLVDFEEDRATALKFLKKLGIGLPTLLDRNGQVAQDYGVPGLPVAVFTNRAGTVTAIQVGQLDQAEVDQDVPAALG
ncbi:MAG TPA: redoxin domain-containing protein [Candidatus Dormibacteraeota bacterium]|nr:redoxin domain-containing protein [Candidatus Dormibacteraeota bacterium]